MCCRWTVHRNRVEFLMTSFRLCLQKSGQESKSTAEFSYFWCSCSKTWVFNLGGSWRRHPTTNISHSISSQYLWTPLSVYMGEGLPLKWLPGCLKKALTQPSVITMSQGRKFCHRFSRDLQRYGAQNTEKCRPRIPPSRPLVVDGVLDMEGNSISLSVNVLWVSKTGNRKETRDVR